MESAGRVEVCIHGVWGRVCVANLYGFYGNYSRVVCRQLGYNVNAGEGELNHALGKRIGVELYATCMAVECKTSYFVMLGYIYCLHENGDFR